MNAMSRLIPARPPLASLCGLGIAAFGLLVDLVVHLTAGPVHDHGGFSASEHGAHLIVVLGMFISLAGVVVDGTRRQARRTFRRVAFERSSARAVR